MAAQEIPPISMGIGYAVLMMDQMMLHPGYNDEDERDGYDARVQQPEQPEEEDDRDDE